MNDATAPYLVLRMSGTEGASLDSVRLEFKNKEDATIGVFWFSENAEGSLRGIDGNLLPALSTTAKEYVIDLGKSGISTDIGAFHVHSGGNAVGGQITLEQVSYATVETVDYAEIMKALPVYQVPDTEKPVLTVNVPATAVVGDSIEIAVKATDDSGNVVTKISVVKDGKDVSLKDSKTYSYTIDVGDKANVFLRKYSWHVESKLDVESMREAAELLLGEKDFRSLSDMKTKKSSVRTINTINIYEKSDIITIEYTGDGFLYHMVRKITALLVEIGIGRLKLCHIDELLDKKDRHAFKLLAPAKGLCLEEVFY